MDTNDLQGKWNRLKGEIRSQWGKLTDDDIERIAGNKDRLMAWYKKDTVTFGTRLGRWWIAIWTTITGCAPRRPMY